MSNVPGAGHTPPFEAAATRSQTRPMTFLPQMVEQSSPLEPDSGMEIIMGAGGGRYKVYYLATITSMMLTGTPFVVVDIFTFRSEIVFLSPVTSFSTLSFF